MKSTQTDKDPAQIIIMAPAFPQASCVTAYCVIGLTNKK